jgi:hypothetical protein
MLSSGRTVLPLIWTALSIFVFSPKVVEATALSYKIEANEKACFYTDVQRSGEKIAFYFAVRFFPRLG